DDPDIRSRAGSRSQPVRERLIQLVGDDLARHCSEPGGENAFPGPDLDTQAVRLEPDSLQELPGRLRAAQVVLGELATPPGSMRAPAGRPPGGAAASSGRRPGGSGPAAGAAPVLTTCIHRSRLAITGGCPEPARQPAQVGGYAAAALR